MLLDLQLNIHASTDDTIPRVPPVQQRGFLGFTQDSGLDMLMHTSADLSRIFTL